MELDKIQYHATQAWLHLSILSDNEKDLTLNAVSRDVLYKAIMLTYALSGGEDAREIGNKTDTEIVND